MYFQRQKIVGGISRGCEDIAMALFDVDDPDPESVETVH